MEDLVLSPQLLLLAYQQGYFPMPHPDTGEILWFHPNPRAILPLEGFHASRSLQRSLRRRTFTFTVNQAFADVISACADRPETWIDERFKAAYSALHRKGGAHSIEVWLNGELVGGLYGVAIAGAFFAESMFHKVTDASKAALHHLVERMGQRGLSLLEVQFLTPHLASLGAIEIPRDLYLQKLEAALALNVSFT